MKAAEIRKLIDGPAFFAAIDQFVSESNCPYVDAVLHYCDKNDIDPELAAGLIKTNPKFKKKVYANAVSMHMVVVETD